MVDGLKGSRHFAPGSISFIAMKLSRPSHAPLRLPQLLGIYADPTQQTGELEERITAVEIALPPQDSETNSPVASLQQSKQLGTKNLVSANAVINSDEPSDFLLFIGAAEWTQEPGTREHNCDLFVEIKVDGASSVLRTPYKKTANWDEYLKITGCLSSIITIEIKSGAHNSSESRSVARADTSLGSLLELCTDSKMATPEHRIAPLLSSMGDRAAGMGSHMGSKHSAANSIGLLTVKLCRPSHGPPNLLQLPDMSTASIPHTNQFERRTPEEVEEREEINSDISARAESISSVGVSYLARFEQFGDLADLENSVASLQQAVALTADGHPDKPRYLSNVGNGYGMRFERLGALADLENSIMSLQQAVALTPDGHPHKAARLTNIGASYVMRFERLGDLADLQDSVASLQQAVALTADGHPEKAIYLSNVGNGYGTRFERLGDLADLENSVESLQQAIALTPDGHPEKAALLTSIGNSY
ncbi:hypothetical protein FIBSPDRAFT_923792, partial [Athelia psychrophila]